MKKHDKFKYIKSIINKVLKYFNLKLIKYTTFEALSTINRIFDFKFINLINDKEKIFNTLKYFALSHSQLRQDLFVLNELNYKNNGFFVEFGATDGVHLSNTWLLEKKFKWSGILAEPAKIYHNKLEKNRKCFIEKKLIWKKSGLKLIFNETLEPEFSTINEYSKSDFHHREEGVKYNVETISLNDLLKKFNSPKIIDYLSIDTEGSEFDILNNFDFDDYKFRIITCEHNYTINRDRIYNLLLSKGYVRKFFNITEFDDWYINPSII
jgi:FkbM family methyltransferase